MTREWLRVGEGAWLLRVDDRITPEASREIRAIFRRLRDRRPPSLVDLHPAYASLLVELDPLVAAEDEMRRLLDEAVLGDAAAEPPPRVVEVPVRYGGDDGPDLDDVARACGLAREEVVALHSGAEYEVAFVGFQPGFAYLSGLPEKLRTERLAVPRARVPAGSVAIAGGQAGVYPLATPGGWRLLGRTSLTLFSADREAPSLLQLGDRIRFRPEAS